MQKRKNPHPLVYLLINASVAQVCQVKLQTKKQPKQTQSKKIAFYRTQECPWQAKASCHNFIRYLQITSGNYFSSILSPLKSIYKVKV